MSDFITDILQLPEPAKRRLRLIVHQAEFQIHTLYKTSHVPEGRHCEITLASGEESSISYITSL